MKRREGGAATLACVTKGSVVQREKREKREKREEREEREEKEG